MIETLQSLRKGGYTIYTVKIIEISVIAMAALPLILGALYGYN